MWHIVVYITLENYSFTEFHFLNDSMFPLMLLMLTNSYSKYAFLPKIDERIMLFYGIKHSLYYAETMTRKCKYYI